MSTIEDAVERLSVELIDFEEVVRPEFPPLNMEESSESIAILSQSTRRLVDAVNRVISLADRIRVSLAYIADAMAGNEIAANLQQKMLAGTEIIDEEMEAAENLIES